MVAPLNELTEMAEYTISIIGLLMASLLIVALVMKKSI